MINSHINHVAQTEANEEEYMNGTMEWIYKTVVMTKCKVVF
jgi:hypothetical protein